MPASALSAQDIIAKVASLSEKHVLKRMPAQYIADFAQAAVNVYDGRKIEDILQHKFHIPDDANFTEDSYLQSASELSVANDVKKKSVLDFETEKRVNQTNPKNVDVYYRIGSTKVSIEVKCPHEEEQAPFPGNLTVSPAGRVPGGRERVQNLMTALQSASSMNVLEGKNRDNRLKDALVCAHDKFPADPNTDELNVLFLACGDYYKMSEWHGYLFGQGGLFSGESFHRPETYRNVDCVILSNLKYRHKIAFDFPAWTLGEVLMIPIINPHARKNIFGQTVTEGLSVFKHYQKEFSADRIVQPGPEEIQERIGAHTKVTWFVYRQLTADERNLFFPVPSMPGTSQG